MIDYRLSHFRFKTHRIKITREMIVKGARFCIQSLIKSKHKINGYQIYRNGIYRNEERERYYARVYRKWVSAIKRTIASRTECEESLNVSYASYRKRDERWSESRAWSVTISDQRGIRVSHGQYRPLIISPYRYGTDKLLRE